MGTVYDEERKACKWFDAVVKSMETSGVSVNYSDIKRTVKTKYALSLRSFERLVRELYIEPGYVVLDATSNTLSINPEVLQHPKTPIPDVDCEEISEKASKEADDLFSNMGVK